MATFQQQIQAASYVNQAQNQADQYQGQAQQYQGQTQQFGAFNNSEQFGAFDNTPQYEEPAQQYYEQPVQQYYEEPAQQYYEEPVQYAQPQNIEQGFDQQHDNVEFEQDGVHHAIGGFIQLDQPIEQPVYEEPAPVEVNTEFVETPTLVQDVTYKTYYDDHKDLRCTLI